MLNIVKEVYEAIFVIIFIFLIFIIAGFIGGLILLSILIVLPICLVWIYKQMELPPPMIDDKEIIRELEKYYNKGEK